MYSVVACQSICYQVLLPDTLVSDVPLAHLLSGDFPATAQLLKMQEQQQQLLLPLQRLLQKLQQPPPCRKLQES
jgi:hypothetical protein